MKTFAVACLTALFFCGWCCQTELLPVPYFHVVFTMPAPVAAIGLQNKAIVSDILFKTAAQTPRSEPDGRS